MLKVTDKKNGTVPEGYQLTSIGIIPLDWDLKPLGMIVDEITQTAGTEMYETVSISAGIGFVNQAKKFGKELSGNQYEKYIVLHKGDFSYNKGNSQKYPQGCIYRLTDRETAAVPNVFESFRIKDGVADYFEQLFISGFLNRQLFAKINHGVRDNGLLNLTGEDFYSCKVPFPPIKEQKKIAEILIQYDKIIELCKCKLEKVIKLKKACMNKMFPEQEKTIPEIRFPGFSNSWEQRKLGEVLTSLQNNTLSRAELSTEKGIAKNVHYGDILVKFGEVLDIRTELLSMITDEDTVAKYKTSFLQNGDVIVADTAEDETVGKCCEMAGLCGETVIAGLHTIPYRPLFHFASGYLGYYMNSNAYHQQLLPLMQGIKVTSISKTTMQNTNIVYPKSEDEQAEIGMYFDRLDHLVTLYQREQEEMVKMKKALMQQLLTGKVRVKI